MKAEDGAEFFGRIDPVDDGQFRASCYARLDHRHSVETETPDSMICPSVAVAKEWMERQAGRRGFKKYKLQTPE
ncbi:MAG: hypothetical protein ACLQUZ_04645 [Rhizomicrobium sp.]